MLCSSASHSVPRWRSSDASPLLSFRPQVLPGSKSAKRKPLPFVIRNGVMYFSIRSRISRLAMAWSSLVRAASEIFEPFYPGAEITTQAGYLAAALGRVFTNRVGWALDDQLAEDDWGSRMTAMSTNTGHS